MTTSAAELLRFEIGFEQATRKSVAIAYAAAIREGRATPHPLEFWPEVNAQIIERWSVSGLGYIKRLAWKRLSGEVIA